MQEGETVGVNYSPDMPQLLFHPPAVDYISYTHDIYVDRDINVDESNK